MTKTPTSRIERPAAGIAFIVLAMAAISVNDVLIKYLSGGYPLHQMVFVRSFIGIFFSLAILQAEGGLRHLRTRNPWLHLARGLLIVTSNFTFFAALAVIPLASASALFFVAPLFITLLSVPILGERVGPVRLSAVAVGFLGVLVMLRPFSGNDIREAPLLILLLPLVAAFTYALNQILVRLVGPETKASAMAIYIQMIFIIVAGGMFLVAGDGRFAEGLENPSLVFLLRPWIWPEPEDLWMFLVLGVSSAVIGYCLSQAYRLASAASVAPFEYSGLPFAIFWGWLIWGDLPTLYVWIGIALIAAAGIFVFLREAYLKRTGAG